jgi:superfamily II DNA or RNA helicase
MNSDFNLNKIFLDCTCWSDFASKISNLTGKQKGDLFENLVKAYLLLDPEYATKLQHVWLHKEVPSSVREAIRLPSSDKGIDLIAQTKEGEFWAVQCKYRAETEQSIPWREISTFTGLAFGVCRNISFGLICSTTERVTNVLKHQEHIGFCAVDIWQSLNAEFFTRLHGLISNKPTDITPLKPRPHQEAAIRDAYAHFVTKKERRGKLIMPCGTGKSLTAYWLANSLKAKRIIVAVPSLALIRQTLKVWLREALATGQRIEWVCVCSDESAGRIERDDIAVLRHDLGVPCLTSPREIADWLGKVNDGVTVVFTTYQSGEAIAQAAKIATVDFDLGIMDEAHKTVGAKDKLFSHLLHDKNIQIRNRVFMTATERRFQGESEHVLSMDDPEVYGETFHLLTFKQALEYTPPILSDYKILTIWVTQEEVNELIKNNAIVLPAGEKWHNEIEAEMLASLVALRKAITKYPIRHTVSFHSSIERARSFTMHNEVFSNTFPDYGNVLSFHVSGNTPTGTRARVIKEFADAQSAIITNARCLTEGVDVPNIDCVLFADPRKSAVDIVQAVGRALRPSTGKEMGYVIVPILLAGNESPEDIFTTTSFKEILTTLRALAANDDRIIEYFRAIAEGRVSEGGRRVEIDVDERIAKNINLAQFVHDIELKCWDKMACLSWRPFTEARLIVHSLGIRNNREWRALCANKLHHKGVLPNDIPLTPNKVYENAGWKGWGDWFGTGAVAPSLRQYRDFNEARAFARSLKLKNQAEWFDYAKNGNLPKDIPTVPGSSYAKKGWNGWGDWLGTGSIAPTLRNFLPFQEARAFVHRLKLKNQSEWNDYCKSKMPEKGMRPANIPTAPHQKYSDFGWKSMGDWLGTGRIADKLKQYRPFNAAREFAHQLNLSSHTEWKDFCNGKMPHKGTLPDDVPASPHQVYKHSGWKSYGDWLGTNRIADRLKTYRPFLEARTFARSLNLKTVSEWREFTKGKIPIMVELPEDIPAAPNKTYAQKGWQGWGDWLGTARISTRFRVYRPFIDARAFARSLKLKSYKEWRAFCTGKLPQKGRLPEDIPAAPDNTYVDKGWLGYEDWLGK